MLSVSEHVRSVPDAGGATLLNVRTGRFYRLNATGATFWAALSATGDVEAAIAAVIDRYDGNPDLIRLDMEMLVGSLRHHGLVGEER